MQSKFGMMTSINSKKRYLSMDKKTLRALLVEDDAICQRTQKKIIETYGFHVDVASTASEALNLLNNDSMDVLSSGYDIIFMDILLPDIDGDRLTEFLRKSEEQIKTPVIAVTSHIMPQSEEKFQAMGITDVISKPMTPEILKEMLIKYQLISF